MDKSLKKGLISFFILVISFQVTLDLEAKNKSFPTALYQCKESNKNDLGQHDIKTKIQNYNYEGSKFKVRYLYTPYYCKNLSLINDEELEKFSCKKNRKNSPFILEAIEPMNLQASKAIHSAKIRKNFHVNFSKEKSTKFSNACIYGNNQRIIKLWNQGLFVISDEDINNLAYANHNAVPGFHFNRNLPVIFFDLNKLHKHSKQKLIDIKFFQNLLDKGSNHIAPRFSEYKDNGYQLEFTGIDLCFEHKGSLYPTTIACNSTEKYTDKDLIYVENGSFDNVHIKSLAGEALSILLIPITLPLLMFLLSIKGYEIF